MANDGPRTCIDPLPPLIHTPLSSPPVRQVVREAWRERSARVLGMGLLTWMQLKAAKVPEPY